MAISKGQRMRPEGQRHTRHINEPGTPWLSHEAQYLGQMRKVVSYAVVLLEMDLCKFEYHSR
jgi:hypothetical protein